MMRDTLTPHTQTNLSAPSPTVLDIYVVWHPKDKCGRDVFDRLVNHYHSEHFSGLAGSAIEVFSRSHPRITGCDAPAPIPTRCGTVDTTAHDEQTHNQDSASDTASPFTVIIPVIGRHMIKASEDKHSAWPRYLKSLHTLRETASSAATPSVLIFPIIGKQGLDISIPPISALTSRQGAILHENAHAPGELVRDIGQAIIQNLLWKQAGMASSSVSPRLRVFISHARADIPETDLTGSSPTGVVSKVKQLAEKTHLETFFDIHDIQAGEEWDSSIRKRARTSALLMVRTDHYSSREWTQWEVFEAKRAGMPVVCLSALSAGETRGSLLLDHVPTVAYPQIPTGWAPPEGTQAEDPVDEAIVTALNRLVDEALKFALWRCQEIPAHVNPMKASTTPSPSQSKNHPGFDCAPPTAPEPTVLLKFIQEHRDTFPHDSHFWLIHPDPPLLPAEQDFLVDLCVQAGYEKEQVHLLTPRSFFAAGGVFGADEPHLTTRLLSRDRPLIGKTLGISMSRSENLASIGLSPAHLECAVAEVSQMMLIGGGSLLYAGAPGTHAPDLTTAIMDTVSSYTASVKAYAHLSGDPEQHDIHPGDMFSLAVPCIVLNTSESIKRLDEAANHFAGYASIVVLDKNGLKIEDFDDLPPWQGDSNETARALHHIRQALPQYCDARLLIGGKTQRKSENNPDGYIGNFPGIVEEALYTLRANRPLFIAGGFGGAAALLARELGLGPDLPIPPEALAEINQCDAYRKAIDEIKNLFDYTRTGLNNDDHRHLVTTQRASELGALIAKGLSSLSVQHSNKGKQEDTCKYF
jgi:hypothetical protein